MFLFIIGMDDSANAKSSRNQSVINESKQLNSSIQGYNYLRSTPNRMGPIMAFPGIYSVDPSNGATSGRIQAEYANLLRLTKDSKYKIVGARLSNNTYARFLTTNAEAYDGKPHYVEISHVAAYQGKIVDVRINVQNMEGNTGIRELDIFTPTNVNSGDFLHFEMRGQPNPITLRYEFIDHETGNIMPFKGTWIVKRINSYKNIELNMTPERMKSLFAYSNSALAYETENNFLSTIISSNNSSTNTNDVRNQFMYSFDAFDGTMHQKFLPTTYGNYGGTRYVYYDYNALAPIDMPLPSIIGLQNEESPTVSYQLVQDFPVQTKTEFYPKRYKMTVKMDSIVKMDKLKYTITNTAGTDVTSRFRVTKNDQDATISFEVDAQTLSNSNFVNNQYKFNLDSEIDWNGSYESYLKDDGYFHIPATMKMESDISNLGETEGIAKTKFTKGVVQMKYVLEDGKTEIMPSDQIEGGVGKSYSVKEKDIPDYKYVRTVGNTSGVFEKNPKIIQFIYMKNPNIAPEITLDQQSSEEVHYDGDDYKISGQVSDIDGTSVKAYYRIDGGTPILIAQFNQSKGENKKFDYSAQIAKEQLKDGNKHKITVYAEDDEGLKSAEKSVQLREFVGELTFISAPSEVVFGENELISAKKETYFVTHKKEDLVVQDTRVVKRGWKMGLKLQQPLMTSSGDTIESAVRYNDAVIGMEENTKIFEQKTMNADAVNVSKDWITQKNGLHIVIPAGKTEADTYSTILTWTLEDTP